MTLGMSEHATMCDIWTGLACVMHIMCLSFSARFPVSVYSGIHVTQYVTCLGDIMCYNIGCMDVIATCVSVCIWVA